MAFPTVQSVTESSFTSASTAHNVSMPATVDSGDLLIVIFSTLSNSVTITTPSGWTLLNSSTGSSLTRTASYYKVAAGTEDGGTVDFVTSGSDIAVAQCYRITGHNGEVEVGTPATNNNINPDCPAVTPSWGAEDTLWIAYYGGADDDATIASAPTSYTGAVDTNTGLGLNNSCECGSSYRQLNASSEDPGTYAISIAEIWVANTIAVRPDQDQSITAPLDSATGLLAPSSIDVTFDITAPLVSATGIYVPTITGPKTITAPLLSASILVPSLSFDQNITAPSLSVTGVLAPSEISEFLNITAPLINVNGQYIPTMIFDQVISGDLVSATGLSTAGTVYLTWQTIDNATSLTWEDSV